MPIDLQPQRMRSTVAWLEHDPPTDAIQVFTEREYRVERCTDADFRNPKYLAGLTAAVLTQGVDRARDVIPQLASHAAHLLDHDCTIVVRAAKPTEGVIAELLLKELAHQTIPVSGLPGGTPDPPLPFVRYFESSVPWSVVANFVQTCPQRPAPNLALAIEVQDMPEGSVALDPSIDILLRRAFWNCTRLSLEPMSGARSGAKLYRAHAELVGVLGESTQPFVVKIATRDEILTEYNSYDSRVQPYVPFHLGPHLDYKRCCLGSTNGLLVLNFVTEAEDLSRCASEGRSASAIACLFDRTLYGWYRQAHEVNVPFSEPLLKHFPAVVDEQRIESARRLGASLGLGELKELFWQCRSMPVLVGPIHGDLHLRNIFVRAHDAVMIDFESQDQLPLLLDAAALEASLLVEGKFADALQPQEWFDAIKPLYEGSLFRYETLTVAPNTWCWWFYMSVRQIRGYARQWQCGSDQYAAALSFALLNKAAKDARAADPEGYRRTAAYVFAEMQLRQVFPPRIA